MRRVLTATAIAAAALMALTTLPADAGSLGEARGVRYKSSTATLPLDMDTVSAETFTRCNKGWHAVGGGISVGGGDPRGIASTTLGGARYWYSEVWHQSDTAATVTGYSTCMKTDKITENTASEFDLPDTGGQVYDTATCSEGKAVSGGMRAIGESKNFRLNASAPVDDASDTDNKPDNGWRVYTQYSGTDSGADAVLVDVVCYSGPAPAYRSSSATALANKRTTAKAACPKRRPVIGGGIYISGAASVSWVTTSRPYDGPDADKVPDDGWTASSYNDGDSDLAMTVYAVCR